MKASRFWQGRCALKNKTLEDYLSIFANLENIDQNDRLFHYDSLAPLVNQVIFPFSS